MTRCFHGARDLNSGPQGCPHVYCVLVTLTAPSHLPPVPEFPHSPSHLHALLFCDYWSLPPQVRNYSLEPGGLTHGHTTQTDDCPFPESISASSVGRAPLHEPLFTHTWLLTGQARAAELQKLLRACLQCVSRPEDNAACSLCTLSNPPSSGVNAWLGLSTQPSLDLRSREALSSHPPPFTGQARGSRVSLSLQGLTL